MKLSLSELQVLEVLLNRIYQVCYKKEDNPFFLVLNVNGHIVSGQVNYYNPKVSGYPMRYELNEYDLESFNAGRDMNYRGDNSIDFNHFLEQIDPYQHSKKQFENLETLYEWALNIVKVIHPNRNTSEVKDANPYGTHSLKNVTFIESGKTLPFLILKDKEYELLSVLLNEETSIQS